jgi:pimeloyl-ACP methyl ester carboxylesterase
MFTVTVFICVVIVVGLFCKHKSKGRKTPLQVFPQDFGLKAETVSFLSSDGVRLKGWFVPCSKTTKTIIFIHGFDMNKGDMLVRTHALAAEYNLLYVDCRGAGNSEGESGMGLKEISDLEGAVSFLRTQKPAYAKEVALYGLCMGAAVSAYYTVRHKEIRCLVLESSYYSFKEIVRRWAWLHTYVPYFPIVWAFLWWTEKQNGIPLEMISLQTNAADILCPVLMIQGELDRLAPLADARRVFDLISAPKELWVVQGAGHTSCHEKGAQAYQDKIRHFYQTHF